MTIFSVGLFLYLTSLQSVHVLESDDVAFVEVELSPVLSDVVPHCHHILRVLTKTGHADIQQRAKEHLCQENPFPHSLLNVHFEFMGLSAVLTVGLF